MNADDAFENLVRANSIAIPVVKPLRRTAIIPAKNPTSGLVRVVDDVDATDADYRPFRMDEEMDSAISATPTETDLEPVDDAESLDEAELLGAHIVGDDAGAIAGGEHRMDGAPRRRSNGGVNLARARQVRRFGFLPIEDLAGFDEQVRDLSARIAVSFPGTPSLLVTSPDRGEGRTEIAIRIALALGKRVGSKILLADFDLKNPMIAMRLGLSSKYFTLAEAVRESCPLEDAMTYSFDDNLYVMPSRPSGRAGDDIVHSRQLERFMGEIHAVFDFAVFDCGPAAQSNVMGLGKHVGAAVLAGFASRTSARRANEAAEKLEQVGATVAGMILSGV